MSIGADRDPRVDLPRSWGSLEKSVEETALSLAYWRRRAGEADGEVSRLRGSLEALASERANEGADAGEADELRRLRAENAALLSRIQQAHVRVEMLLKRLVALGMEP
jgi:hypothetical protein